MAALRLRHAYAHFFRLLCAHGTLENLMPRRSSLYALIHLGTNPSRIFRALKELFGRRCAPIALAGGKRDWNNAVMHLAIFLNLSACGSAISQGNPVMQISDWSLAREQGWNIAERNDNRGAVFVQGTTLLLADSQGEKNRLAEVSFAHPLEVPERFVITLKLRLLKIGYEDDTTGEKCSLRMIIGARSPHGDYGLNFLFLGDRYKVDKLFKIFRTDDQWHTWRFEVDTARKTVAMFRDGEYVCLHEAGEAQKPGVRFQLQGSPDVPGRVEIADFRIESVPAPPLVNRIVTHPPAQSVEAGEWPLWRRDVHNTALSPLSGKIKKPRIAWSVPAGATAPHPAFFDLDGDGHKEVLISHGGNLTAYTVSGKRLWSRRLEGAVLHGVFDLDGDGERELLISSGFPSQVQILRVYDGTTRYTCPLYPMAGVGGVRVARLDPKKKGLQAVVWSNQHEKGFCLSFERGIEKARVDWIFDWKMTNFTPAVALSDMNRDGVLDVVVCTYDHTFVFDGRSGKPLMKLEWNSGRNYGTMVVRDIDGDGYPDVVMLADVLREHIGVIKNEDGKALRLLWDRFYEQNYPEDHKSLRVLAESVDDFDGDGKIEIVYSLYDGKTDSRWHTLIVDAVSGNVKADLPDVAVAGAGPLFPSKPPVLIFCKPSGRYDLHLDRLTFWTGNGGHWAEFTALPNGSLMGLTSPRDHPLFVGTTTGTNTTVLRRFRLSEEPGLLLARAATGDNAPYVEFLVGEGNGRLAARWSGEIPRELIAGSAGFLEGSRATYRSGQGDQVFGQAIEVEEIMPEQNGPQIIVAGADGALRIVTATGGRIGTIRAHTGFVTQPVVARLRPGESPVLLYMDANSTLRCVRVSTGGKAELLWSQPGVGYRPYMVPYLEANGVPFVMEIDGDGEKEVLIARRPNQLVALNPDGAVKKTWQLPALPIRWTFGNFDGDEILDLFVTYPTGAYVDVESAAIAGKDGKVLWHSHCGNGPPAVYDLDGDGIDDVILRDLFERRTLNGLTGRDIIPTTHWAGYHTPVVLPLEGESNPPGIAWVGGMYSVVAESPIGKQRWWRPFRPHGQQAVADVDGDGRYEIGGVTAGQLYNWPRFYAVDGPNREFVCYDALRGNVKWLEKIDSTCGGVVAVDIDGDGRREFLVATSDGRLVALCGDRNTEERRLWELIFPAALGPPIACDADGDGEMEILVGCADGNIYCVQS